MTSTSHDPSPSTAATVAPTVWWRSDDVHRIGLVGGAHFSSHFLQLAFAPLFPFMSAGLGVGYAELGLIVSVFYAVSGVCQALMGAVVDRFGARPVLLAGLTVQASAVALAALVPSYWMLFPLAALAGLGNSVYHPADLSILSLRVDPRLLGRAFGVHQLGGTLGYATAPVVIGGLALLFDWRIALLVAGGVALIAALLLWLSGDLIATTPQSGPRSAQASTGPSSTGRSGAGHRKGAATGYAALLSSPALISGFLFFMLASTAGIGVQTYAIPSLGIAYGLSVPQATQALTIFLLATAAGMGIGGIICDRTSRHDHIAIWGMVVAAALMALASTAVIPPLVAVMALALAGFCSGLTNPARDLLIRAAIPPGATGKAFGLVYSGLDAGSTLAPLIFGLIVDSGAPAMLFLLAGLLYASTIGAILVVRRLRVD